MGTSLQSAICTCTCTCTCTGTGTDTGYVRPDVGRRLIAHMRFRYNLQRASFVGLGCAGAFRHCSGHITDARASSGLVGHYVVAPKA
jgi:predicted naringenin-chalcone synthase